MGDSEVVETDFVKALGRATKEYMQLYRHDLAQIRKSEDRVSAVNMCFMRARDLVKEDSKVTLFTFTVSAYDPALQKWVRCPGCGDPDINQTSSAGKPWQGCYKCSVLLGSKGIIKAMDPSRGKVVK